MNKADYKLVVETLQEALGANLIDPEGYHDLTRLFGEKFAEENPNFNFSIWQAATKKGMVKV
jgi:hypothetical protein